MSLAKRMFIGLLLLGAAELGTFILVAQGIGWLRALGLLLAMSLFGVVALRHAGRNQIRALRAALATGGTDGALLQGPRLAPLIGGILLVLPGFITGLVGALLLLPPIGARAVTWGGAWALAWAGATLGRDRSRTGEAVIDLEPGQWHAVGEPPREQRNEGRGEPSKEP
jgi:UPF0716 protein FxsA